MDADGAGPVCLAKLGWGLFPTVDIFRLRLLNSVKKVIVPTWVTLLTVWELSLNFDSMLCLIFSFFYVIKPRVVVLCYNFQKLLIVWVRVRVKRSILCLFIVPRKLRKFSFIKYILCGSNMLKNGCEVTDIQTYRNLHFCT